MPHKLWILVSIYYARRWTKPCGSFLLRIYPCVCFNTCLFETLRYSRSCWIVTSIILLAAIFFYSHHICWYCTMRLLWLLFNTLVSTFYFFKRWFWVQDYNLSYYYGANIRFNLQHNKIVSVVVFIKKTEFLQLISEYRHVMNSKKCINCK